MDITLFDTYWRDGHVTSWSVKDFKAIGTAGVTLDRLNVVCGKNSSGKSSYIQSLLLLAQSPDGQLILNGPLVRLGKAEEVVRQGCRSVTFEWEYKVSEDSEDSFSRIATLQVTPSRASGRAEFEVSHLSVREGRQVLVQATRDGIGTQKMDSVKSYRSAGSTLLRVQILDGKRAKAETYIEFDGLNPTKFLRRNRPGDSARMIRRRIKAMSGEDLRMFSYSLRHLLRQRSRDGRADALGDLPEEVSRALTGGALMDDVEYRKSLDEIADFAGSLLDRDSFIGTRPVDHMLGGPRNAVLAESAYEENGWTAVIDAIGSLSRFSKQISYIGPLREEPQVLSTTGGRLAAIPAGIRGEYTADLLVRNRTKSAYMDPKGHRRKDTLRSSVAKWAAHLEIGDDIGVREEGKLGRGLTVDVDGFPRDLTTIGVGASQLLPVLTVVLAARAGTTVILEQPELHLHPAVQARLGDFFVTARPDVQLIVETHSEYLVTRVRRRVAEGDERAKRARIIFADRKTSGGSTRTEFQHLAMDDMGTLDVWPDGFFDTLEEDSRAIVISMRNRLRNTRG